MIQVGDMVNLWLGPNPWIGQVIEIVKGVALIRLMDNMHYHAYLDELTLFKDNAKPSSSEI